MTEDRVLQLIEAYGADPMRWPIDERADAQTMLAASADPRLRKAIDSAKALDGLLALAAVPKIQDETMARLRADAIPARSLLARLRRWIDWPGPIWQPTGALAAALVFGVWLGAANPDASASLVGLIETSPKAGTEEATDFDSYLGTEDSL